MVFAVGFGGAVRHRIYRAQVAVCGQSQLGDVRQQAGPGAGGVQRVVEPGVQAAILRNITGFDLLLEGGGGINLNVGDLRQGQPDRQGFGGHPHVEDINQVITAQRRHPGAAIGDQVDETAGGQQGKCFAYWHPRHGEAGGKLVLLQRLACGQGTADDFGLQGGGNIGGLGLVWGFGMIAPIGEFAFSRLVWVAPEFQPAVLIGLGLPLYLVTMASQNLPGFAVLRAGGYVPPSRSVVAVTGVASLITALFGGHTTSLAAITASICTGKDAHPDKDKRWLCGPVYALGYGVLALFGAWMVGLIASVPPALVAIVAGVALLGPFMASARLAFSGVDDPLPAAAAFIVTVSGASAFGIGAAFWGLVAGVCIGGLARLRVALA